jgi:hypothetical protein
VPSITIKQLHYDLTPTAGPSLVGHYLNLSEPEFKRIDAAVPVRRGGVSTSDVLRSYLGLLAQGKSDFDAIDNVREDEFFRARWASRSCPRARRCASGSMRRPSSCSMRCPR